MGQLELDGHGASDLPPSSRNCRGSPPGRACWKSNLEETAALLAQVLVEICCRHRAEKITASTCLLTPLLRLDSSPCPAGRRTRGDGELVGGEAHRLRAVSSLTHSSQETRPGFTTAAHPSGRLARSHPGLGGLLGVGVVGEDANPDLPPRRTCRVMARRAARSAGWSSSMARAPGARRAERQRVPRWALPWRRPRWSLRNFVRFGIQHRQVLLSLGPGLAARGRLLGRGGRRRAAASSPEALDLGIGTGDDPSSGSSSSSSASATSTSASPRASSTTTAASAASGWLARCRPRLRWAPRRPPASPPHGRGPESQPPAAAHARGRGRTCRLDHLTPRATDHHRLAGGGHVVTLVDPAGNADAAKGGPRLGPAEVDVGGGGCGGARAHRGPTHGETSQRHPGGRSPQASRPWRRLACSASRSA